MQHYFISLKKNDNKYLYYSNSGFGINNNIQINSDYVFPKIFILDKTFDINKYLLAIKDVINIISNYYYDDTNEDNPNEFIISGPEKQLDLDTQTNVESFLSKANTILNRKFGVRGGNINRKTRKAKKQGKHRKTKRTRRNKRNKRTNQSKRRFW